MVRQTPYGSAFRLILMPALAVGLAVGCSSSSSTGGSGGKSGSGGSGKGGSGSGGTSAKGGSSGSGGNQSGGAGGSNSGGSGSGGSGSGGSNAGGSGSGGAKTGGAGGAGGSNAGGSGAGGASAGGSGAGGASAGGSGGGGSSAGGSSAGGSGAGGVAGSGGSANGGSGAGGSTGTGGAAGPVTCGSVTIPSSNDIISDFANGSLTTPTLADRGGNTWDTWSSVSSSLPKTSPNVFEVDSSQSGPCNRGGSLHVKSANEGTAKGNNVGIGIDLKPFVDASKKTKSTFDAKAAGYTGVGFWMKCSADVEYVLFKIPDGNNDRDLDGPSQPCTYDTKTDGTTCNQFGWKNVTILKNNWQYLSVFFDEVVPDVALTPRTGAAGTFDPSKLTAFQVQVNVGTTRAGDSALPNPFECWVDDVYFLKDTPPSKSSNAAPKTCSSNADAAAPGGYYTKDNKIMDCKTGNQKIFKGLARPTLEFDWAGWNINYPDLSRIKDFGANVVRYSLNQSYWLDSTKGAVYQTEIDNIIKWTLALGMDVILDLHWLKSGQSGLPDSDSATFWQQIATKYKGEGRVIFEIYNEPYGTDGSGWKAAMQPLVDAIRNTASAKNLILAGGLDWAYHLDQVLPPTGPGLTGSNIAYVTHPYDIKTNNAVDTSAWDAAFGNLAKTYPVVATEFGQTNVNGGPATPTTKTCDANFYKKMLDYFADPSRTIGWTGWSWFVDHYNAGSLTPTSSPEDTCGFPQLITSYDGTTNSAGAAVKAAMK